MSLDFAYVHCRVTQELLSPTPRGELLSHCPLTCSDVTVGGVTLGPGPEIPCRLNFFPFCFSLTCMFVGILCVLWFIAMSYGQEEEVGKRQELRTVE